MPGFRTTMQQLNGGISKCGLIIFALLCLSCIAFGQQGQGKLTGKVTDGSTNEPLAGVSITVKGRKSGTASITDGTYIFSLAPGTYTIAASYQSYSKKELTGVEIKAGQTTFLDLILDKANDKLIDVVITSSAKKESQSAAYSAQKRSAAASDGISKEAINKTPDNNAGQILKRVTGVSVQDNRFVVVRGLGDQYNQTTMNGVPMTSTETNRNAFAFDLIPAAVIDNITINKTATPDMPGNFAGGIVQINTKDFPANDFFSITLQGGFSDETLGKDFYNDKRGKLEALTFSGGIRALPSEFPTNTSRVQLSDLNIQEQFRLLKKLKNNFAPINYGPSKPNENIQLGYGKTIKFKNETQLGIVAAINQRKTELIEQETQFRDPFLSLDQNDKDKNRVDSLQGLRTVSTNVRYRYSADFGAVLNLAYRFGNNKVTFKNLYTRVLSNNYADRNFIFLDNDAFPAVNRGITHFFEERGLLNSGIFGEHRTGKTNETRIDWNFNGTFNSIKTPDTRNYLLKGDSLYEASGNISQLNQALFGASRVWAENKDVIYSGAFNITSPFEMFGNKHLFKTGILFQNRDRRSSGTILPVNGGSGTLENLFSTDNYFPGGNSVNLNTAALIGGTGNYNAGSSLLATYISLENKIRKKTKIIWGIRAENYQQNVNVFAPVFFDNILQPEPINLTFASRSTFSFLPSINIVYSPIQSINVRGAFSKTVIRPELKDLAAFERFDLVTFALQSGNPLLRSSSVTNIDFKLEWFPSAGEILSFSAFYKKIQAPIEYAFTQTGTSITSKVAINTGDAVIKGIEAEIRKKVDFVPALPWLSHLTLFGNGALLSSNVDRTVVNSSLIQSFEAHSLSGQPSYIINAGFSVLLMKETLEATLSFNRTGDNISELGSGDLWVRYSPDKTVPQNPHFYVKARDLVDLVITKSILKNRGKFKFNIGNLLKQRFQIYQDINGNKKLDSPVVIDGSRGAQDNYVSGVDNVTQSILPQRNYSLSFTYTF